MNVNIKMMIGSENTAKVAKEPEFACAACRKDVGSNIVFCHCCRCWMYKRYSDV